MLSPSTEGGLYCYWGEKQSLNSPQLCYRAYVFWILWYKATALIFPISRIWVKKVSFNFLSTLFSSMICLPGNLITFPWSLSWIHEWDLFIHFYRFVGFGDMCTLWYKPFLVVETIVHLFSCSNAVHVTRLSWPCRLQI